MNEKKPITEDVINDAVLRTATTKVLLITSGKDS